MRLWWSTVFVALASLCAPSCLAQDFMPMAAYGSGLASATLSNMMLSAPLTQLQTNAFNATHRASGSSGMRRTAWLDRLTYTVTPTAEEHAQTDYISRVRKQSEQAATAISTEMRAHNFGQVYSGIVAPFGLHRGDVGDAMTAYTLLGWMIATGSTDPTRAQVAALRERIAAGLAAEPKFANPATRAALGEEIVISFVTLHAGWQSARREGKLREYSDGVAAMFEKQTGNDLRQLVLTDRGLERRG